MRLGDMIERKGVRVDAQLSRRLLMNIFYPRPPLHDGAGHFEPREDHSGRLHSALSRGQRAELLAHATARPWALPEKATPWPLWFLKSGAKFLWP